MRASSHRGPVTFDQAPDGTVTLQPQDLPTWQQYLTDFDGAITQTQGALAELQGQNPPTDPVALDAYNQLVSQGQTWLARLQNLQAMRDSVASWASGLVTGAEQVYGGAVDIFSRKVIEPIADVFTTGAPAPMYGLGKLPVTRMYGGGGLGILPLVIAGVGLAAFAAVVYGAIQWGQQASRFAQLNRMAQAAITKGTDPAIAYAQAGKTLNITAGAPGGPGLLESLGGKVIWAGAFLVLAIWALPKLLAQFTSRGE